MKRKRIKTKETDAKNVKRETVRSERSLFSRLTIHDSRSFIHIACLVFLVLIVYANTFHSPFQWDEKTFIIENPIVKDLHYFARPSEAKGFELYSAFINRYIGYLTFALNYKLDGLAVTGYHIVNIAIHIANTVLVYWLVLLTLRTPFFLSKNDSGQTGMTAVCPTSPYLSCHSGLSGIDSRIIAFFSAAIFAVHPLQTEAVTYVFQRFASLSAFFYLLSLTAYIKARLLMSSKNDSGQAGMTEKGQGLATFSCHSGLSGIGSQFMFLLISVISAILAMKTKENAFTLPLVITLYEFCFFTGPESRVTRLRYLVPLLLTLLIIPFTLMSLTGSHRLDPASYAVFSREDYLLTQFRVIVTYLRLLFFPVNQNLVYDYPVFKSFFDLPVILSFLFLSALFGLGVYLIKTKDNTKETDSGQAGMTKKIKGLAAFGCHSGLSGIGSRFTSHDSRPFRLIGFGILWFFITLSVESSIVPLPMLIDEYHVYLPSVGLIISAVTGAFLVFSRFTIHGSRPLGVFSRFTSHVSQPLVSRFLIVALVFAVGGLSVATHLRNELWTDKIRLWENVADKSPDKAPVHLNLGCNYQERNMLDKAIEQYLLAIKLEPRHAAAAHNNLGVAYKSLNMPGKAEEEYLAALRLDPDNHEYHYNLGIFYKSYNMLDKAMEQYLIAIKLKPDYAVAHNNLGGVYMALNLPDKAEEEFVTAIRLQPDLAQAHFSLGLACYKMGQMEKAQQEIAIVLEFMPDNQQARELLRKITERQ